MGPDIQVDFGRELYVPWRISEGDHLYSDIAYFNGPLSAHWNALCFVIFGVGLKTLKIVNLAVTVGIAALVTAPKPRKRSMGATLVEVRLAPSDTTWVSSW
jgi:hypothetical protein